MTTIEVTQEHIDKAFKFIKANPYEFRSCNCPIALAATEHFGEQYNSDGYAVYQHKEWQKLNTHFIINHDKSRAFIQKFDTDVESCDKTTVKPFTLEIE